MSTSRLRFAPAPTGSLHIGSARTALYNWLYARHTGGELILRIEDTNAELTRPELIDNIYRALEWLQIDFDGEPVRQSERTDLYNDAVERWLSDDLAYVDDGAVRFRVPNQGTTSWEDAVRGNVVFENQHIEDFVVRRSDGTATFFTANAVDDLELGITHVVRGEDLVNVTPKVIMLRQALGSIDVPEFAHLPLIVNQQRKKLSKRRDDVALESYRDRGILATAMINYLALLGWGPPDDIEVRPVEEIVELFELGDVNPSSAMFDAKKLEAINGEYIRALNHEDFYLALEPWIAEQSWGDSADISRLRQVAPLIQERTRVLSDGPPQLDFFFLDAPEIDQSSWEKVMVSDEAALILEAVHNAFVEIEWEVDVLHDALRVIGDTYNMKLGKAQAPVRVAVTGRSVGPPLFESMHALGRDTVLTRIAAARKTLTHT
ncbi:MAG: glutamate--tRNA ligase family protein [Actinomycetota bacterium]|nr:glutamate--tRNA ligase family protein [Actinomycetota bacterium]MEC9316154.1 glutamate--tRNA ligase family protein [Actinomycetota bacterium]